MSALAERSHNIGIDINEKHTECDGNQQQRFELMTDSQIKEETSNQNHGVVTDSQVEERCLMEEIVYCINYVFHL